MASRHRENRYAPAIMGGDRCAPEVEQSLWQPCVLPEQTAHFREQGNQNFVTDHGTWVTADMMTILVAADASPMKPPAPAQGVRG